jgi:EpsI family protein
MKLSIKNIALLALMLLSAGLGAALRPTISLADERPPIDLPTMVPPTFGEWREEVNRLTQVVNPQQKSVIDKIYSQTLSRTYINPQGYRIMLSIAYGKNQSDALQLHKPEICYPAQGFTLLNKQTGALDLPGKLITGTRIATSLGQRFEPVTYWTVVGDHNVTSGNDKKLTELRYAMHNRIPDGMLVRVSSIDKDTEKAYRVQNQFASTMIDAIGAEHRQRFAGNRNTP